MTKQLDVFGGENIAATAPKQRELGKRQQFALQLIRDNDGLTSDEVGARIHAWRGKHHPDSRCDFCGQEGKSVLRSLRARGLVVRRQSGEWTVPGKRPSAPPAANSPKPSQDIPYR